MAKKESKLDTLYAFIESAKQTGIALTEEQLSQTAKQEEQYIKEEVLPLLGSSIEPVLRKIRRELTLVVNYSPNEQITLRISRSPNLSDLEEAETLTPDNIPEYRKRSKQKRTGHRSPKKALRVTMDDGTVLDDNNATNTFCEVIQRIGLIRVRSLDIMASGINIVSTSKDPNRKQRKMGDYYIFTNRSTTEKANILKEIVGKLGLAIKVDVID